jgi:hypothetical protein
MELVQIQKSPSWTSVLTNMKVNQEIPVDINKRSTIAPLISRQLSLSHPKMKWETSKKDDKVLIIKRTA